MSAPLDRILPLLRSPGSLYALELRDDELRSDDGRERYPIVRGIPILIDDRTSAFSIEDFRTSTPGRPPAVFALKRLAAQAVPSVSANLAAQKNYRRLAAALAEVSPARPRRVLVVGGSVGGAGFEELLAVPGLELVETDVSFGPRTDVICDGHSLPFSDETFDAVVCQAVLEHVADPPRVVEEIWRVLAPRGLVYSEIPFMQQVHEGAYDFTRYTLIGHRRLYRRFEMLHAGATGGPGMALAWSVVYFARALGGRSQLAADVLAAGARLVTFWLKYLDRLLVGTPAGLDAASGTFLFARKSGTTMSDRQLVQDAGGAKGGYAMWRL